MPFPARFPLDRPYHHMQRASEERGQSQENQRSVHDPPEDRYPHSTVPALVP